jgi:hypothetical protein
VIFLPDDLWVVADTFLGIGSHELRVQWQGGLFPWKAVPGGMELRTPEGGFQSRLFDGGGVPLPVTVVEGEDSPPRGWISRYYGEKLPAPSLAVRRREALPCTWVSVLSGGGAEVRVSEGLWTVEAACGKIRVAVGPEGLGTAAPA